MTIWIGYHSELIIAKFYTWIFILLFYSTPQALLLVAYDLSNLFTVYARIYLYFYMRDCLVLDCVILAIYFLTDDVN